MKSTKSALQIIGTALILFFLTGCSNYAAVPSSPTSLPPTLTFTPKPTATLMPTSTPVPTSTAIPIPPLPTIESFDSAPNPVVQITNLQGVGATVTLNVDNYGSFDLMIADGVYEEIPWFVFRRAYQSEGQYIVTLADGQELKGQMDFALNDQDGKTWEMRSVSSMVLVGLDKLWLSLSIPSDKKQKPGHSWQLHIMGPEDLTFTVVNPQFGFEYTLITHNTGLPDTTETAEGLTESFTLELGGIAHNLSSLQGIQRDKDDQLTITQTNGTETTGGFFPILNFKGNIYKGTAPNWYLRADSVDYPVSIIVKSPVWTLTK